MKRFKGEYDTSKDIAELQAEKEEALKEAKVSLLRLVRSTVYRQQLFVALVMPLSQQFSGINAVRSSDRSFIDRITLIGLFMTAIVFWAIITFVHNFFFFQIFYYSTAIFHKAGVAQPVYAPIGVGVVNTVFTLVSVPPLLMIQLIPNTFCDAEVWTLGWSVHCSENNSNDFV